MSRTVAITADSPPSDYGTSNDQQTARHLLRENWCMLVGSFTSAATAGITDTLYEKKIISEEEMENIQCKTTRKYMARSLLSVMSTKSWTQCLTFCDLVHQREGMEDIGTKLLETAGKSHAYAYRMRRKLHVHEASSTHDLRSFGLLPFCGLEYAACMHSVYLFPHSWSTLWRDT